MTPLKMQAMLLKYDAMPVLTLRDIKRLLNLTPKQTNRAVADAVEEGVLTRIKSGLYCLSVRPPSAFALANYLMDPSYISLESALSYYRVIPETVYAVTSVTPKYPKRFEALNRDFTYHKMNRRLYFGYRKVAVGGTLVLMAEKEKAVLDYLYFVVRGLRKLNSRADFSNLNKSQLSAHAEHFRNALQGRKRVAFDNLLDTLNLL
jgi:predicted transcriptional regulator of viral defense system